MDKRINRPAPRDVQIKRLCCKFGFSDQYARMIADLCYCEVSK